MSSANQQDQAAERGATADTPRELHWAGWKSILKRIWVNSGRHNIGLLSAGVALYAFLSFGPLLGAVVMTYGLIADPATVAKHLRSIIHLVPTDAARLISEQLTQLTQSAAEKKGIGLLVELLVSIYGASRASSAMIADLEPPV